MFRRDEVSQILGQFAGKRLLVLGDIMVDAYITGNVERISPEAPVPVLLSEKRFSVPGGAANVANNIVALGAEACLVGIVGSDAHGREVCSDLDQAGIDVSSIVVDHSRPTTVKTRVVAGSQQIVRVDTECRDEVSEHIQRQIVDAVMSKIETVDAIVVSDYQKGLLTPAVVSEVIDAAKMRGIPVVCNPKPPLIPSLHGATLLSVNIHEARAYARVIQSNLPLNTTSQLLAAASTWLEPLDIDYMLVTLGKDGCIVAGEADQLYQPAYSVDVSDPAGAGDTVISMMALCMVSGVTMRESMLYANAAAGSVVRHVGVVPPQRDELLQLLCDDDNEVRS